MKEQIKSLWERCFDESKEYIEMYFNLRYTEERNMGLKDEGQVVSALQMIPYPMTFCGGRTVPTSYISGACTHPDFRGKGAMRELLTLTFESMLNKEVLFSTLIPAEPWLFTYYERVGYASVFQYSTKEVVMPDCGVSTSIAVTSVTEYKEDVYQYLNKKLSERSCCIQHTSEDFKVIMADLAISEGFLLVAEQDHIIQGIAILYQKNESTVINELFAETKEIEHNLVSHIAQYIRYNRLVRLLPADNTLPTYSLGMARIINAQKVLRLYAKAFPEEEMKLHLSDEQVFANNGFYHLYQGKCSYSINSFPGKHVQMTIKELTQKILAPLKPYMSLMLN